MAANAVVIIGDQDYMLPSAAVGLSARKNISRPDVDVIVFVVASGNCERICLVADRLASERVIVRAVDIRELRNLAPYHIDKAVPVSALSRLWLDQFLAGDTRRFLYLDGDVLVEGQLDPLFEMSIPVGGLLAADDCLCLYEHELRYPARHWRPYLQSIGVAWRDYFNTGVLLVDREGWERIASDALKYLVVNAALCRSSDQTALNVVIGERRGRLPLRWNYQTEHMMVLDPRKLGLQPTIWHFAGGPKPWDFAEWPWDDSFNWAFREAQRLLAEVDLERPPVNKTMLEEGRRHRRRQRNLQRWRFLHRRLRRAWKSWADF